MKEGENTEKEESRYENEKKKTIRSKGNFKVELRKFMLKDPSLRGSFERAEGSLTNRIHGHMSYKLYDSKTF